jgi:heme exporter protein D
MAMDYLWLAVVAIGPLVLGMLIAYAIMSRRREGPATRRARQEATERVYREEPGGHAPKRGH